MTTIWVVRGETGEYSHQSHWIAKAFTTDAAATAYAALLLERWRALAVSTAADEAKAELQLEEQRERYRQRGEEPASYLMDLKATAATVAWYAKVRAAEEIREKWDPNFDGHSDEPEYTIVPVDLVSES